MQIFTTSWCRISNTTIKTWEICFVVLHNHFHSIVGFSSDITRAEKSSPLSFEVLLHVQHWSNVSVLILQEHCLAVTSCYVQLFWTANLWGSSGIRQLSPQRTAAHQWKQPCKRVYEKYGWVESEAFFPFPVTNLNLMDRFIPPPFCSVHRNVYVSY